MAYTVSGVVCIWHEHKRLVLWVLGIAGVNAREMPNIDLEVQHPNLLAPLNAPAPDCPHEASTGDPQVT